MTPKTAPSRFLGQKAGTQTPFIAGPLGGIARQFDSLFTLENSLPV
jgi:hypothetical protein